MEKCYALGAGSLFCQRAVVLGLPIALLTLGDNCGRKIQIYDCLGTNRNRPLRGGLLAAIRADLAPEEKGRSRWALAGAAVLGAILWGCAILYTLLG